MNGSLSYQPHYHSSKHLPKNVTWDEWLAPLGYEGYDQDRVTRRKHVARINANHQELINKKKAWLETHAGPPPWNTYKKEDE